MKHKNLKISRRSLIKAGSTAALGTLAIPHAVRGQGTKDKKFVFVVCATGGASVIDSFMAPASGPISHTIVQPQGSNLVAVEPLDNTIQGVIPLGNGYSQVIFLQKHGADTAVMAHEVSSVNHIIAAKRAVSGDNVFGGRTIMEAVAEQYGKDCLLPNLSLSGGGYALHGDDTTLSAIARGEPITDPLMFAFATHGYKGLGDITAEQVRGARDLRSQLEVVSRFHNDFKGHSVLDAYRRNRDIILRDLEKGNMVSKLMLLDPATNNLSQFGFEVSGDMQSVLDKFPNLSSDPYEAKMALAFLAAKNGMSNAFSISPSQSPLIDAEGTPNSPIAFDWSHVNHRGAQNAMWSYMLKSVDGLIDLLKITDIDGEPEKGKMWEKSLIYIATEFGRDKVSAGGSGHHLNNGSVIISPMVNGNRIYGGVDATTGLTYGFDPNTGALDQNQRFMEADIYSAVAQALGIQFDGRKDKNVMIKGS